MLIRPTVTSLVLEEHFFCIFSVLTRLVGLISTKTIEYNYYSLAAIYAFQIRFSEEKNKKQRFLQLLKMLSFEVIMQNTPNYHPNCLCDYCNKQTATHAKQYNWCRVERCNRKQRDMQNNVIGAE